MNERAFIKKNYNTLVLLIFRKIKTFKNNNKNKNPNRFFLKSHLGGCEIIFNLSKFYFLYKDFNN